MAFEKVTHFRRPNVVINKPIKEGIALAIRTPKDKALPVLELKLNVDVMKHMTLLIGDRIDIFYDETTHRLALQRHPNGEFVIRHWYYSRNATVGGLYPGKIQIRTVPNLAATPKGQVTCQHVLDDAYPSMLIIQLPASFFTQQSSVYAELKAA